MAAVGVTAAAVVLVADTGEGVIWEEGPWEEDPWEEWVAEATVDLMDL